MASDRDLGGFFVLAPRRGSAWDTEFFKMDPVIRGEAPTCEACGRFIGSRRWLTPRRAQVIVHGNIAGDFAFSSSSEFLISEAVSVALEAEGLTGLADVEEVEVAAELRPVETARGRYFFGQVALSEAQVDWSRSRVARTGMARCETCLGDGVASIHGFAIADETWSGVDIFIPCGLPGVVVASAAFRRVAIDCEFTNLELVPSESYTWMA